MKKIVFLLVVFQLIFPANIFAAQKTVVVLPVHDGSSDNISDDLSDAFSKAMARRGVAVVSKEKVSAVIGYYHRPERRIESGPDDLAGSAIVRAKEHYYNFDHEEAMAQIRAAIKVLEERKNDIFATGAELRDAYIVAAIIEKSSKDGGLRSKSYFKKALNIDPSYSIDVHAFPPSTVEVFDAVKRELLALPSGSVAVDTDPKAAEVYVNGVMRGVSPVTIEGLPEGEYEVTIATNKYIKVQKIVGIVGGKTAHLKEKLAWAGNADPREKESEALSSEEEARERIDEGGRIADLLKVGKVVMIDADEKENGSGSILIRMVDRKYKAGHNPVVVNYSADKRGLLADLTSATGVLAEQMNLNLIKNPQKHLDPDGIGDPVLLGKRNKALYTIPAFWAIVGGALAATAGGAAAAVAMSGGGENKPASGSVNVQFK